VVECSQFPRAGACLCACEGVGMGSLRYEGQVGMGTSSKFLVCCQGGGVVEECSFNTRHPKPRGIVTVHSITTHTRAAPSPSARPPSLNRAVPKYPAVVPIVASLLLKLY